LWLVLSEWLENAANASAHIPLPDKEIEKIKKETQNEEQKI